ncbi:NifU family protein [bacterium]|nr:NifU family protein [bacterium]
MTDDRVISISEEAQEAVLGIRDREPDASELALRLSITGARGLEFTYELTFVPIVDAADGDAVEHFGDLPVIVAADSAERLTGASINIAGGGLAIENPNSPVPMIAPGDATMEGPVADRVQRVLVEQINPAIASHGGFAELVSVEGEIAYLRLGGGCQGCGLAQVTLSQGIERALIESVPEIMRVVDVTDHSTGDDPYYESSKK